MNVTSLIFFLSELCILGSNSDLYKARQGHLYIKSISVLKFNFAWQIFAWNIQMVGGLFFL